MAAKIITSGSEQDRLSAFCDEVEASHAIPQNEHVLGMSGVYSPHSARKPRGDDDPKGSDIIFTPLMDVGSLNEFIKNGDDLKVEKLLDFATQIAEGLWHLHLAGMIHGDVAARNVLLNSAGILKISDFGKSEGAYEYSYSNNMFGEVVKATGDFDPNMQPWRWLPPELYTCGRLDSYSDVWAYGITIWELFTKCLLPYKGIKNFQLWILASKRLMIPKNCPWAVYFLLIRCWHMGKKRRPLLTEILESLKRFKTTPEKFDIDLEQMCPGEISQSYEFAILNYGESITMKEVRQMTMREGFKSLLPPYKEAPFLVNKVVDGALQITVQDVQSEQLQRSQQLSKMRTTTRGRRKFTKQQTGTTELAYE